MSENEKIDIIKGAILLEHRSKALYESVVQTTKNLAVKELFRFLVREEESHIEMLNKQYGPVFRGNKFDLGNSEFRDSITTDKVLTEDIVSSISGAGYEAAVIAAALDFEKKAVNFYSENAGAAGSAQEKKLYTWLTDWEKGHMHMLAKLDNDIKEQIWYDNSFWPLD